VELESSEIRNNKALPREMVFKEGPSFTQAVYRDDWTGYRNFAACKVINAMKDQRFMMDSTW
jgi:hypothetical protein